jgi:primosomal protein N' (replication factor Y)
VPGEVVVQTQVPGNEIIFLSKNADYGEFIGGELKMREAFRYPPYRHIINGNVAGKNLELVQLFSKNLVERLKEFFAQESSVEIRGPMVAPLEKLRDHYRYSLLIFAQNITKTVDLLRNFYKNSPIPQGIQLSFDVDALDFS